MDYQELAQKIVRDIAENDIGSEDYDVWVKTKARHMIIEIVVSIMLDVTKHNTIKKQEE